MSKIVEIERCSECPNFQGLPKLDAIQVCWYNDGRYMTLNNPNTKPPIVAGARIPVTCPLEDAI